MSAAHRNPPTAGELRVDGRPISWRRDGVLDGCPLVLLAHGAGAPFTHAFMQAVALGLAARSLAVVRFHFPYMERNAREQRHGAPDRPPVLLATWRAMLEAATEMADAKRETVDTTREGVDATRAKSPAATPLIVAGKSMGGRIGSMLLADTTPPGVRGAIYFGYPLSPAGKPDVMRADHLAKVEVPQLFISGSRDSLCNVDRLRLVLKPLGARAQLHVVEGGDHSLATNRKDPLAESDAWLDVAASWIHALPPA